MQRSVHFILKRAMDSLENGWETQKHGKLDGTHLEQEIKKETCETRGLILPQKSLGPK